MRSVGQWKWNLEVGEAEAMIFSQTMVAEADIRVLDVNCHVPVAKDQKNFQIDDVQVSESVHTEISSCAESSRFQSVMSCFGAMKEPIAAFLPTIRSGSYADIGCRNSMDDEHICVDDLSTHLGSSVFNFSVPSAFYGVFDGHGGPEAAVYIKENAMRLFFRDADFPEMPSTVNDFFLEELENVHRKAFLSADLAMADESIVSGSCGTTALTALLIGQYLLVANSGDCRAVLCRKGVAVDLSFDHRSSSEQERRRVEDLGGFFDDVYLNGVLSVTRALGDWEMKLPGGSLSPLIPDPDVRRIVLTEDDEFLVLGCDGIWDVMSSQYAVSLVRQGLRRHDDPRKCAMELVKEALRLNSSDNLTVVVVCLSSVPSLPQGPQRRRLRLCASEEDRRRLQALIGGN